MTETEKNKELKFRAHESFYIRKGWLSKGMKNVAKKNDLFIDKNVPATVSLGLGTNMVKSLKYWLGVTGLIEKDTKKGCVKLSDFGKTLFENDKYLEEMGTIQLLQYKLASNFCEATSWFYFFNEFNFIEFTKEDFILGIRKFISEKSAKEIQDSSLASDFECIINTYLSKHKTTEEEIDPENNISCPLAELNLISVAHKKNGITTYKKTSSSSLSFNKWIILAIICDNAKGKLEISIDDLLNAQCNIGKCFNLDSILLLDILQNIEKSGELKIIRTAGLDVIQLTKLFSFEDCVQNFYKELNK